jgi:hypothetical protein
MIWFTCKQCGKSHNRADNLVGTMIFCDCGNGLRVPWSSTIEPPEETEEPIPLPPARPVPPAERTPPARPIPPPLDRSELGRRREARRVNPAYCLNHDEAASTQTCADCRMPFCDACVVTLQGQTVCGPCKNFRIRALNRPAQISPLAIVSLVVAVVSGPVSFCLSTLTFSPALNASGSPVQTIFFTLIGLLLPGAGLVLGALALRDIETKPNVSGRATAMTGSITALVGVLWTLTVGVLMIVKHVQT